MSAYCRNSHRHTHRTIQMIRKFCLTLRLRASRKQKKRYILGNCLETNIVFIELLDTG